MCLLCQGTVGDVCERAPKMPFSMAQSKACQKSMPVTTSLPSFRGVERVCVRGPQWGEGGGVIRHLGGQLEEGDGGEQGLFECRASNHLLGFLQNGGGGVNEHLGGQFEEDDGGEQGLLECRASHDLLAFLQYGLLVHPQSSGQGHLSLHPARNSLLISSPPSSCRYGCHGSDDTALVSAHQSSVCFRERQSKADILLELDRRHQCATIFSSPHHHVSRDATQPASQTASSAPNGIDGGQSTAHNSSSAHRCCFWSG